MDAIVGMIMNRSSVTVEHINITQASPDTLTLALVNRLTGTGPTSATMAPMTVDLVFGGVPWGKLQLPEVLTAPGGSDIVCPAQEVKITNQEAFRAFVKALMLDDELTLTLDNGDGNITSKVLGFTMNSKVTYRKDLKIKGMRGPKVTLAETTKDQNTMKVVNPSPLEIDHGVSIFEIKDADGDVVAELKGPLHIRRGTANIPLGISFKGKKVQKGQKLKLVGVGTEDDSWRNETLKYINEEFEATEEFASLSG